MYKQSLQNMLDNFELNAAERLSVEIHDAESEGYIITYEENTLWTELTAKIQATYHYDFPFERLYFMSCRCCGKEIHVILDEHPIHTMCIAKHWGKHAYGVTASRCKEFRHLYKEKYGIN